MNKSCVFVFALIFVNVQKVQSNEVMKGITSSFFKVLDECKRELGLTDNVLTDLYYFWKQDHPLMHRDTGCAIVCMSQKLNLLDTIGKLHHGNAQEFAINHGAGEQMAKKLVTMVHECEQQFMEQEDSCLRALDVAKCFRTAMHDVNWAPKFDIIVTEVLTEVK
ncbi:pheromone-binding protein-like [Danaus plexippus]|nr:pheromone-binding protein-like [Danaus plexippus]